MGMTLDLNDFPGADARTRINDALRAARRMPGSTLVVPPGTYILTSALARKTQADVLAGLHGENPEKDMFSPVFPFTIGLDFDGHEGTTLDARGATLLVNGYM